MHQDPGLAAAGPGENQHVLALCSDRLTLGIVEGRENVGHIHRAILTKFLPFNVLYLQGTEIRPGPGNQAGGLL
jgi:hypothetical protein